MGNTVVVFDRKLGHNRELTRRQFSFLKGSGRFILQGEEEPQPTAKKKDVAPVAVAESDHTVIEFEDIGEDVDDIESLREEYLKLSGEEKVDKRWKEDRLREEIEKLK